MGGDRLGPRREEAWQLCSWAFTQEPSNVSMEGLGRNVQSSFSHDTPKLGTSQVLTNTWGSIRARTPTQR